ncbi:TPA: hypothetical protein PC505_003928 [Morganella morganii]|nr:hypothetical protein [Morganella morganii]HDF2424473.1 hypothetical protein [Morganella morganii]HED3891560.1 hypothetical protein [Morganella morganii]
MLILLGLGVWVFSLFYSSYVITLLWSWFIVPFGIGNITIPWAIGLCCLASMGRGIPAQNKDSIWHDLIMPIVATTLFLIIGFFAQKFM